MLREQHGRIPLVLLRIAGVYDDIGHSPFIAEQIARIYLHRVVSHFYPGMLCAGQSFLHVDDLCDAIARLVERRASLSPKATLLVGEPEALGYAEVQDIIGNALHGAGWPTVRIPRAVAKAGAWMQDDVIGADASIKPWLDDDLLRHPRDPAGGWSPSTSSSSSRS